MVELLEGVAVEIGEHDVLNQRHHGHRGGQRFGQRRDQQCRRGAVLGGDDADLVRNAGIGIGHDGAGIFRAITDLGDAELRPGQVDQRGDRLTEHEFYVMACQRGGEQPIC